jgi:tellurite resistance protein
LLGSDGATLTGQPGLAEVMFGFGALSWLVVGSIVLGLLAPRPALLPPPPLLAMLAIEVGPPAVASLAWFDSHGDHIDAVASTVLAQVRLVPAFRRMPFMPSRWSFAFACSAAASAAMH